MSLNYVKKITHLHWVHNFSSRDCRPVLYIKMGHDKLVNIWKEEGDEETS